MDDLIVTLTKYTSSTGAFSSTYSVNDNGELREVLSANCVSKDAYQGTAEYLTLPFSDFLTVLTKLNSNEALGYSLHGSKYENVVNIVNTEKENPDAGKLLRTKEYFKYRERPGVLVLDCCQPNEYEPALTQQLLLGILIDADPQIADTARIVCKSVSDGISLVNEDVKKENAFRIYIPVKDASDIPRYGQLLFDLLWLHGYGHIALSANGKMLIGSPIDVSVLAADYLDIVGVPILEGKLSYKQSPIRRQNGTYLDTRKLKDLTAAEKEELAQLITDAKDAKKPEAVKRRAAWKKNKIIAMSFNEDFDDNGVIRKPSKSNIAEYGAILETMLKDDCKTLDDSFKLEFITVKAKSKGRASERVIVRHLLWEEYPDEYDTQALADPVEGLGCDKITARFLRNNGEPVIHSFVNGEHITYCFEKDSIEKNHWKNVLQKNVDTFNETHTNVIIGVKNYIMRLEKGEGISEGRMRYGFYSQGELSKVYKNTTIKTDEKKQSSGKVTDIFKNTLEAWVEHEKATTYRGNVGFFPGEDARESHFNTWIGFGVKPYKNKTSSAVKRIKKYIKDVICNRDDALYDYVIKWIAYTIQNPNKAAGIAIVLRGDKECGKAILGNLLCKLWGNHGLHVSDPNDLVNNFNDHLVDTCFLFADEAFTSGDQAHAILLKSLVTDATIKITRKGVSAIQQKNYTKVLMTTNADYIVPIGRNENCYCIIDVATNASLADTDYFDDLECSCNSKRAQAAFLYEMKNVNITEWDIKSIPDSPILRDQRYQAMGPLQHWLADALVAGTFGTEDIASLGFCESWLETLTTALKWIPLSRQSFT